MEENFLKILEQMLEYMKELDELVKEVISDRISTPIGQYNIQTGPSPSRTVEAGISPPWVTVVAVETKDGHTYGPVGVEGYQDKSEAIYGHDQWRHLVMDAAPMMLKDIVTGEVVAIGT